MGDIIRPQYADHVAVRHAGRDYALVLIHFQQMMGAHEYMLLFLLLGPTKVAIIVVSELCNNGTSFAP